MRTKKKIILSIIILSIAVITGCKPSQETDNIDKTSRIVDIDSADSTDEHLDNTDSGKNDSLSDDAIEKNALLSDAFNLVDAYPIQDDIGAELWLAAQAVIESYASGETVDTVSETNGTSETPFATYTNRYKELVAQKGLHYVVEANYFGMTSTSEYWVKNNTCKKVEDDKVSIYSEVTYIEYIPSSKTGSILTQGMAPSDITAAIAGPLSPYLTINLEQIATEKVLGVDCLVYFMDVEIMGMKGMTLFVDEQTGILVKQIIGDEKTGFATTITQFDIDGFEDSLFEIPSDISLTDLR